MKAIVPLGSVQNAALAVARGILRDFVCMRTSCIERWVSFECRSLQRTSTPSEALFEKFDTQHYKKILLQSTSKEINK
jgi:hypothetical protein